MRQRNDGDTVGTERGRVTRIHLREGRESGGWGFGARRLTAAAAHALTDTGRTSREVTGSECVCASGEWRGALEVKIISVRGHQSEAKKTQKHKKKKEEAGRFSRELCSGSV